MPDNPWFWLLLPLVAGLGWGSARWRERQRLDQRGAVSSEYFRGLNYLLNEEPDKAIELFLGLAEVNRDTVETHLALGNLFRRRGEVEKAIGFHRHIISRERLTTEQRCQALFELAEDFYRAGLLDRAEALFVELSSHSEHVEVATRRLLALYQQERDWARALEQARRLAQLTDADWSVEMAHFKCELALEAAAGGDRAAARRWLQDGRADQPECVRIDWITGDLLAEDGQAEAALVCYRRALEHDPDLCLLLSERLLTQSPAERRGDLLEWLDDLARHADTLAPRMLWAEAAAPVDPDMVLQHLGEELQKRPAIPALALYLRIAERVAPERAGSEYALLAPLVRTLSASQPAYRCRQCGYDSPVWHWQCPSCRHWETVRPVTGVYGI
ncbi:MAG: lipopolysaccharide assembly protein LapB [Wenzhouxiangellaceae bacterium]|nr:lipopolysaccharide assembly protein LapB [Wenzhouxiangellaceae bacterium]